MEDRGGGGGILSKLVPLPPLYPLLPASVLVGRPTGRATAQVAHLIACGPHHMVMTPRVPLDGAQQVARDMGVSAGVFVLLV